MKNFYCLISVILLGTSVSVNAQGPVFSSSNPIANTTNIPLNSNLAITFNQNVNSASASSAAIKIHSRWRGYLGNAGTFSGGGTPTITFDPNVNFYQNEPVNLIANTQVKNTSNVASLYPYNLQYRTRGNTSGATYHELTTIGSPYATSRWGETADYDGDGDLDLAISNNGTANFSILLNNGFGDFPDYKSFTATGLTSIQEMRAGDLDNDGDVDLVMCNLVSGTQIKAFLNDGSGNFTASNTIGIPYSYLDLKLADMDGDGFLDIVACASSSTNINVYLNNGAGAFNYYSAINVTAAPTSVCTADFNGDGFIDAANTITGSSTIQVRYNDGSGLLTGSASFAIAGVGNRIETVDYDNDGDADISTYISTLNKVYLYNNNGSGTFTLDNSFQINFTGSIGNYVYDFADFDGNGGIDMYSVNSQDKAVYFFKNNGSGTFTTETYLFSGTFNTTTLNLTAADFNGDAVLDIWVATTNTFFFGKIPPTINYFTPVKGTSATEVYIYGTNLGSVTTVKFGNVAADNFTAYSDQYIKAIVDTGTVTDEVTLNTPFTSITSSNKFYILTHVTSVNPSYNSTDIPLNSNLSFTYNVPVFTQVNNPNEYVNVVGYKSGSRSQPGNCTIWGGGAKTINVDPGKDFYPGEVVRIETKAGIVDSANIIVEKPYHYRYIAKTNTVTPSFPSTTTYAFGTAPAYIEFLDWDGDGDMDQVVDPSAASFFQVRLNSGTGTYGPVQTYSLSGAAPKQGLKFADFDLDGDLDFVEMRASTVNGVIGVNNGSGSYTLNYITGVPDFPFAFGTDIADINGDLYPDIVAIAQDRVYVWYNNQTGGFQTAILLIDLPITNYNRYLVCEDFDNDGDRDIVVNTVTEDTLYYYQCIDGLSQYKLRQKLKFTHTSTYPWGGMIPVDYNGDGYLDLYTLQGNCDQSEMLINSGGNFGSKLTIDLDGTAGINSTWRTGDAKFGDMNGDGKQDLVFTEYAVGNTVNVRLFNGSVYGTAITTTVGSDPYAVGLGDIDGDGDLDWGSADYSSNTSTISLNAGTGTFPNLASFTPTSGISGTTVTLSGTNLGCASSVTVNGVSATFVIVNPNTITLTVPAGATTGPIALTCGTNSVSAPGVFVICPAGPVTPSISIATTSSFPVCANDTVLFTSVVTNEGTGPLYDWKVNGVSKGHNTFLRGFFNNNDVVSCTLLSSEACASISTVISNSITATVNPLPGNAGLISGNLMAGVGSTQTFSISPVANATSYQWSLPQGWSNVSTSNSISTTIGNLEGYVSVTPVNSCGSGNSSGIFVDISTSAFSATVTPSTATICPNNTVSLSASGNISGGGQSAGLFMELESMYGNSIIDLVNDANGNMFACGYFVKAFHYRDTTIVGPGTATGGTAYVAKFDKHGTFQWLDVVNATGSQFNDLQFDPSGNLLVGGVTGAGSWGATTWANTNVGLLSKLNPANGAEIWTKTITNSGTGYSPSVKKIKCDNAGNIYISGGGYGTIYLPGITLTLTYQCSFAAKLNTSGTAVWGQGVSGASGGSNTITDIGVDGAGTTVYFVGGWAGSATFSSLINTGGNSNWDGFVAKLNASTGAYQNVYYYSGGGYDYINGVAVNSNSEYYISGNIGTGTTISSLNNLVGPTSFIAKKTFSNSLRWVKTSANGNVTLSSLPNEKPLIVASVNKYGNFSYGGFNGNYTTNPNYADIIFQCDTAGDVTKSYEFYTNQAGPIICPVLAPTGETYLALSGFDIAVFDDRTFISGQVYNWSSIITRIVDGSSSSALTYNWTPGNMTTQTVSVTPSSSTTYTVVISNGSMSDTAMATVTVNPAPSMSVSATATNVCAGTSTTISASGANTYTWTPGGQTSATVTPSPTTTTVYTVTGTGANSCQDTVTITINVNQLPNVTVSSSPSSSICFGDNVTLSGNGASSYSWTQGVTDGVAFTPSATATYSVTGTDANNCQKTATVSVTVNPLPTVSAVASPSTTVCSGTNVTLNGSGASTYSWSGGIINGLAFSASSSATYTVVGSDANSCNDTAYISITVKQTPVVTYSQNPDTVCLNAQTFPLSGGTPSGGIYSGAGVTTGNFDPNAAGIGSHSIMYSYTDTNSCAANALQVIYVDACLGAEEDNSGSVYTVYPNPANSTLTVSLDQAMISGSNDIRLDLFNTMGQRLVSTNVTSDKTIINLTQYESGVYFIQMRYSDKTVTKRFVKN